MVLSQRLVPSQATINLVMIVRNEAAVISRCLRSVRPFISHWTICDTGSTDRTLDLIAKEMEGIPGELHTHGWINFEHNRNLSLRAAKGKADYHLLLDADMVLNQSESWTGQLAADGYLLRFTGENDYAVIRLISDRHEWLYHGVTHECIHTPTAQSLQVADFFTLTHFEDGSSRIEKYQRDRRLLEEAAIKNPADPRTCFYLAQTYNDLGEHQLALQWYEKRVMMEGWQEEKWYSIFQMGRIIHATGGDWRLALHYYLQAFQFRPTRLEPLYYVAQFYRSHNQWRLAHLFAKEVCVVAYPNDTLFIQRSIYTHLMLMEYGLACQALGGYAEAMEAFDRALLAEGMAQEDRIFLNEQKANCLLKAGIP